MRAIFCKSITYISTIALTACTVGPYFHEPSMQIPTTYAHNGDIKNTGAQRLTYNKPLAQWWKEFHSPIMQHMMDLGIAGNYNLVSMQERLAEAREQVIAATGQLWPQASLSAAAGRQKYGVALFGPVNTIIPPYTYYEIGPSVNLALDVFGGMRRTIEKQKALMDYQQQELQGAFLNLTGNIATTTLLIATINEQIAATKQILKEDNDNLELVRKAYQLGSATKVDVLSAQSQHDNDETLLPPLYQQLTVAKDALTVLLGQTPATWVAPDFWFKQFVLPKQIALRIPSELIHKRPDIMAAEATLHAANADIGIATANLYPSITLTGTVTQEALTPGALFHSSSAAWSLLGGVTTPIFNGGTLRAQQRAAQHAYQSAYADYQNVVIKAFSQVNDALHALQNDERNLRAQRRALATAGDSLRLARMSYNTGSIGVLQVLDAERLFTQAKLGVVQAQSQQFQDTVKLYVVMGG